MKIGFKFGPTPSAEETTELSLGAMTLLVGPNGAGKSLVLREVKANAPYIVDQGSNFGARTLAVRSFSVASPREAEARRIRREIINQIALAIPTILTMRGLHGDTLGTPAYSVVRSYGFESMQANSDAAIAAFFDSTLSELKEELRSVAANAGDTSNTDLAAHLYDEQRIRKEDFYKLVVDHDTLVRRLHFLEQCPAQSLHETPKGALALLLKEPTLLKSLNDLVSPLLGLRLIVDPSAMQTLQIVTSLSDAPPSGPIWESSVLEWFANASPLAHHSDGVRAFVAIVARALTTSCNILLVDEPEVSLHPPLARQLGAILTNLAERRGLSIIAATHSPDFAAGCLSTRHPVSICRLDYRHGKGSAKVLPPARLREMITRPRLRASNTLGALFHQTAIICEGPPDRLLYSEINERLLHHEPTSHPRTMADCQLLEHGGMGAIPEPLAMLRDAGVRTAAIFDRDLIYDRKTFKSLLSKLGDTPTNVEAGLAELDEIAALFPEGKKGWTVGVEHLTPQARRRFESWLDKMAARGIFISERGELEDWLPELELAHRKLSKSKWISSALEKLGPIESEHYPPADCGVWTFIRRVAAWLAATPPTPDQANTHHAR